MNIIISFGTYLHFCDFNIYYMFITDQQAMQSTTVMRFPLIDNFSSVINTVFTSHKLAGI